MGGLRKLIPMTYWMMVDRHAGADRRRHSAARSSASPASSPRTPSSKAPIVGTTPVAGFAFVLLVVAALLHQLLLLAPDLHDLPRRAARRATRSCTMCTNRRR